MLLHNTGPSRSWLGGGRGETSHISHWGVTVPVCLEEQQQEEVVERELGSGWGLACGVRYSHWAEPGAFRARVQMHDSNID